MPAYTPHLQATFTRDAFEQFSAMPLRLRQVIALRLHALAAGRWQLQQQQQTSDSQAVLLAGGCTMQHGMAQLVPAWRRRHGGISNEGFADLVSSTCFFVHFAGCLNC